MSNEITTGAFAFDGDGPRSELIVQGLNIAHANFKAEKVAALDRLQQLTRRSAALVLTVQTLSTERIQTANQHVARLATNLSLLGDPAVVDIRNWPVSRAIDAVIKEFEDTMGSIKLLLAALSDVGVPIEMKGGKEAAPSL